MLVIRILSIIALGGSIAWMVVIPGFEPLVTTVGSLSALISTFYMPHEKKKKDRHYTNTASNKLYGTPNLDVKDISTHRDSNYDD